MYNIMGFKIIIRIQQKVEYKYQVRDKQGSRVGWQAELVVKAQVMSIEKSKPRATK